MPEFAERLHALYEASGLSYHRIIELGDQQQPKVTFTKSSLSDWFSGRSVPTHRGHFRLLVELLESRAAHRCPDHRRRTVVDWEKDRRQAAAQRRPPPGRNAPGPAAVPPLGRPIDEWDPHDLEVHPAGAPTADGTTAQAQRDLLPAYVRREHDRLLADAVTEAAGGRSRMVVLVGSSSTGKTRACWEAVQPLAACGWRLWHPFDPTRAEAALDALRRVEPQTVIWLNESQHYLGDPHAGERIAAALHTLLSDTGRGPLLVLGTLWPEHANRFMDEPTSHGPDPHSRTRALLAARLVDVPNTFGRRALALAADHARDGDQQLADALTRAHTHGRLAQELAGAPELLRRFRTSAPLARALLSAAMDARRLGVGLHLPQELLLGAAPGYLTDDEQDELDDAWETAALADLARRIRGRLAALRPVPKRDPQEAPKLRLADYLEQHGRTARRHLCPPASFWAAADGCLTDPVELAALGEAAWDRGLYRESARLHRRATDMGDPTSATALVRNLHTLFPADPDLARHAAGHAVRQVRLEDPAAVRPLVEAVQWASHRHLPALLARIPPERLANDGPSSFLELIDLLNTDEAAGLVARLPADYAARVRLDHAGTVVSLLEGLRKAEATSLLHTVLTRDPAATVSVDDPHLVVWLLDELRELQAHEQIRTLARRAAEETPLHDADAVRDLLDTLTQAGTFEQFTALAERIAATAPLDQPKTVGFFLHVLLNADATEQADTLLARDPAAQAPLDDSGAIAMLLTALWAAGADRQVNALLAADLAARARLDHPDQVMSLLYALREICAGDQYKALTDRIGADAALDDPAQVARWLGGLAGARAQGTIAALLARHPGRLARLDRPKDLCWLMGCLQYQGATDEVRTLARRIAENAPFTGLGEQADLTGILHAAGAHEELSALLARDLAAQAPLHDLFDLASLLWSLRRAGADEQAELLVTRIVDEAPLIAGAEAVKYLVDALKKAGAAEKVAALADRLPDAGHFAAFLTIGDHATRFAYGRQADGSARPPWTWDDVQ
ncbi:hypothetical protein ABT090_23745 [Streptomyces asoensis]|uniref:hypothetical protein n=1 Tax=Streptomyces asoensis TaxID=249586 RepID=UPI00332B521F